jgi:hypothetical protein
MRNQNNSGNVASDGAAVREMNTKNGTSRRRYKNGGHRVVATHSDHATIGSASTAVKPIDMTPIHQFKNADVIVGVDPAISSMKPIRDLRDHQFENGG